MKAIECIHMFMKMSLMQHLGVSLNKYFISLAISIYSTTAMHNDQEVYYTVLNMHVYIKYMEGAT